MRIGATTMTFQRLHIRDIISHVTIWIP